MEKYLQHLKNTQTLLKKSLKHKKPYTVSILDKNFIVLPKVFSPKYFFDTEIFAKNLPIEKNSSFLEIGPGTGIISVVACFKGAKKVVAIDINPQAVKNTSLNIQKHKLTKKN
jgi:release factor glutamine methyltransferase